ncbi:MAG: putative ABC transporter ATP-binding protein YadG [Gammaproteobacteria bacterium]|nr:putative ABC transporter ATP-binding protein YadG [Gammaproteobacteria bacterium]
MHALEIRQLTKVYKNGAVALKSIDLTVDEGAFFALLGPNGAGKSTTIGIISSLVNKTGGTVRIFGVDMDTHLEEAKSSIGLVPQEINFSQFETVLDIVVNQAGYYGVRRPLALARAEKYLGRLGLWERRNHRSRTLSGGMKRRLMIARAMLHEPRLLILDEPTAGVDIELRRSLWDFLRETNAAGTTIILTTHYLEEAESLCRNIAIIDKGEIIENTTMKHLLAQLNVETFILDLRRPLAAMPDLDCFALRRIDETTLSVDISKDRSVNELFAQLSARGIEVASMRNKANRLEEVFMRLLAENSPPETGAPGAPPP